VIRVDDLRVGNFVYINSLNRSNEYLVGLIDQIKGPTVILKPFMRLWSNSLQPSKPGMFEIGRRVLMDRYRVSKRMDTRVKHAIIQSMFIEGK
jgi:N-acyl-L-homoserine lactone synthetase